MKVKYIKSHAQRLINELYHEWDDDVALDLSETLADYVESMTGGEKEPEPMPEPAKIKKRKRAYRLRDCVANDIYKKVFELATEASRLGRNSIFITPASIGVSPEKLYNTIKNINTSGYRKSNHPDCHVTYRTIENGYQLTFSRNGDDE